MSDQKIERQTTKINDQIIMKKCQKVCLSAEDYNFLEIHIDMGYVDIRVMDVSFLLAPLSLSRSLSLSHTSYKYNITVDHIDVLTC